MSSSVTRTAGNEPVKPGDPAGAAPGAHGGILARMGPRTSLWLVRAPLAALAGVLLYLGFPPRPLWWLAPLALALLAGCLHGRRARAGFGLGFLTGLGFMLPLLVWTGSEVG
ncbi:apolipoprotein N-acyltransferase, partial [Streptomyces sp. NPDC059233]